MRRDEATQDHIAERRYHRVDVTRPDAETSGALPEALDAAQLTGHGDMPAAELRAALHRTADLVADYLEHVEDYAVLPPIAPGDISVRLSKPAPEQPEPLERIMRDVMSEVLPNVTHWQHPGFLAYFSSSASAIGLLGEMVTTGLNANAFLWRTSPVGTELEAIAVGWLRDGLGLPAGYDGVFNDTASTSSLAALAAARQHATGNAARTGLHGADRLRIYTSTETHSSIERAAMILGIGRDGVRKIPVDHELAMDVAALRDAIDEDRRAGWLPVAVVATIGTTSTTAVDPTDAIADICETFGVWLHVDAAYAGPAALIPAMRVHFEGWERAESIVVNPHKWMFTPLDCSLLLTRRMDVLRDALSLVPEYLRTTDGRDAGQNYSEYTPQLGRRARGIKMWMQLRYFGLSGLRSRLRSHLDLTQELTRWIDAHPDVERLAPVPFGTVCFRWRPARYVDREAEPEVEAALDLLNERLINDLNAGGQIFISHTRVNGRFALRISIGNIRTDRHHIEHAWRLVQASASRIDDESR